jgi:hypothetical protein
MRWTRLLIGTACYLSMLMVESAHAASSLSAPLTSFDGGNFSIASPLPGDAFVYDASGAHVGTITAGDGGRNFQRTIENDYATVPFTAEITFELSSVINDNGTPNDPADDFVVGDTQAVFFGLGAGGVGIFGTPDWDTANSSASFWPETGADKFLQFTNRSDGAAAAQTFFDFFFSPFDPGTHRFQMVFDPATKLLTGSLDINYAGGPFVADVTGAPPIDTSSLFAADGWPSDPSRIFFGGDDGAIFRDLVITVVPEPASATLMLMTIVSLAGRRRTAKR